MQAPRWLAAVAAAAVLTVLTLLGGCATGSTASPADEARALTDPVTQATSAVQTALLAVRLLGDDRATVPVTDTALLSSVQVLAQASDAVTTFVPADRTGAGWQTDALRAVQSAQVSVSAARGWANDDGSAQDEVTAALQDSADGLDRLTATLTQAGGS